MAVTMKDLEQRLDAVEKRLDEHDERGITPDGTPLPPGEPAPDAGKGGDLEVRVARLENLTGHRLPGEVDRTNADKAIVSRFANTREEAIAQQAARERLAEQGLIDAHGRLRSTPAEQGTAEAAQSTQDQPVVPVPARTSATGPEPARDDSAPATDNDK